MTNKEKFLNLVDNSVPPMHPKQNIPASDLRKGNLVLTEAGVMPVHFTTFDDVYVQGLDGRVLYVQKSEGVPISKVLLLQVGFTVMVEDDTYSAIVLDLNDWVRFYADNQDNYSQVNLFIGFRDIDDDYGNQSIMKYFHEIQNLFYWLTRQELLISSISLKTL